MSSLEVHKLHFPEAVNLKVLLEQEFTTRCHCLYSERSPKFWIKKWILHVFTITIYDYPYLLKHRTNKEL